MKAVQHFRTITEHRNLVLKYCIKAGIPVQGLLHDLSKYSPTEFIPGAKYYQGDRSPNEKEREIFGYSLAWMHHKGRNRHHFEYWTDLNPVTKKYEPVRMPLNFVTEMFCDRVSASRIYKGDKYTDSSAYEYFLRGNARAKMHPDTADLIESWLKMLSEKGEDATFSYIKMLNHRQEAKKKFF